MVGEAWPSRRLMATGSMPAAISWLAWVWRRACRLTAGSLNSAKARLHSTVVAPGLLGAPSQLGKSHAMLRASVRRGFDETRRSLPAGFDRRPDHGQPGAGAAGGRPLYPKSGHSLARGCERLHPTFPDCLGRAGRGKRLVV